MTLKIGDIIEFRGCTWDDGWEFGAPVVGLDSDGSVIDKDGTLFGPESGRNKEDFEQMNMNPDAGETIHINIEAKMRFW